MITLTLKDINEANIVFASLAKLPYAEVGDMIPRLRDEVLKQISPAPPASLRKRISPA